MDYSQYIRTRVLLDLQTPQSPHRESETMFIVAHQASELWLKSIIENLTMVDRAFDQCDADPGEVLPYLRRTLAGSEMLVHSLNALRTIEPAEFAAFRPFLGTATGAQSSQFHDLTRLVGLGRADGGPIDRKLGQILRAKGVAFPEEMPPPNGRLASWYWVIESLRDISSAIWRWGMHHLDVTDRMIGDLPGTGGTCGVAYLASSVMSRPFPTLWGSTLTAPVAVSG